MRSQQFLWLIGAVDAQTEAAIEHLHHTSLLQTRLQHRTGVAVSAQAELFGGLADLFEAPEDLAADFAADFAVPAESLVLSVRGAANVSHQYPEGWEAPSGYVGDDLDEASYCKSRTREEYPGKGLDKIWLFVQSGPRSGSTLTHELLSAFEDVSVICRFWRSGEHAEVQTVVSNTNFQHMHDAWSPRLAMYHGQAEPYPVPTADDYTKLPEELEGLWLHPGRAVFAAKAPAAVYFTDAIREAFEGRARFIQITVEPYAWTQHLRETYFNSSSDDMGYPAAMRMVTDIQGYIHKACKDASNDTLVMRYEDLAEHPRRWMKRIQEWLPQVGQPPDMANLQLEIHNEKSEIFNMDPEYVGRISSDRRKLLKEHFRTHAEVLQYFGYSADEPRTVPAAWLNDRGGPSSVFPIVAVERQATVAPIDLRPEHVVMFKRHALEDKAEGARLGDTTQAPSGFVGADVDEEDYCDNMRALRWVNAATEDADKLNSGLPAAAPHSSEDALWLFVQSGPRSGSTLTYELLSAFESISTLCRFSNGEHAEMQTQVTYLDFPGLRDAWNPRLSMYQSDVDEPFPTLNPDDYSILPAALQGLWLHPERPVLALKSPPSVYFTEAIRQGLGGRARFIQLVVEPYAWAQHLRETYFKAADDQTAYRAAMRMVTDIAGYLHAASADANPDTLVMRYEDLTEEPDKWLGILAAWLPEVGTPPKASDFELEIHDETSEIYNMDSEYTSRLSADAMPDLREHFRAHREAIEFFGYSTEGPEVRRAKWLEQQLDPK